MQKALEYAQSHTQQFQNELNDLIRIPSVSTDSAYDAQVRQAADWLVAHLRQIGLETELIDFGPTTLNGAIRIDVMTPRGRVRVFNLHLQSNRFGSIETEMIAANPQQGGTTRPQKGEGGFRILRRLKEAALLRSEQAERMAGLIAQSQYPRGAMRRL